MRLYDQLRLNWPPQAAAALAVCVPNAEAHALTNALYRSGLGSRLRAATTATDAVSLLHKGSAVMGETMALSAERRLNTDEEI
jgi:hypothetical protein